MTLPLGSRPLGLPICQQMTKKEQCRLDIAQSCRFESRRRCRGIEDREKKSSSCNPYSLDQHVIFERNPVAGSCRPVGLRVLPRLFVNFNPTQIYVHVRISSAVKSRV